MESAAVECAVGHHHRLPAASVLMKEEALHPCRSVIESAAVECAVSGGGGGGSADAAVRLWRLQQSSVLPVEVAVLTEPIGGE